MKKTILLYDNFRQQQLTYNIVINTSSSVNCYTTITAVLLIVKKKFFLDLLHEERYMLDVLNTHTGCNIYRIFVGFVLNRYVLKTFFKYLNSNMFITLFFLFLRVKKPYWYLWICTTTILNIDMHAHKKRSRWYNI